MPLPSLFYRVGTFAARSCVSLLLALLCCVWQAAPVHSDAPPNVLIWMMDDVGFAQVSAFGGLVETPNIDRVAAMGLRYTNYHTAPICSAARASFLTGRMPHSVHIGGHATAARDFPGYDGLIPASAGTVAENLRQRGYATFAIGKWDHLPNRHASPAGPFHYWPQGQGFEIFYGFLAADTDNWNPTLLRGKQPVPRPKQDAYHLSEDMAEQAIAMLDGRRARDPSRPFLMYWATGAAHAPHHAPADWIERYRGRFDMGWDVARDQILRNQITLGIMQDGTQLAARPEGMPAWNDLPAEARELYARQMEVFAASLAHADAQFGRVLDALEDNGELANTIIIVVSDNGASAEGGPNGLYNEAEVISNGPPGVDKNRRFLERWGGPETYPHYAYGWAVAGDTPFRYFKQTTHEGGTRVPLVISWPEGIAERNGVRNQFVHVSDIAPTLLDATGTELASFVNDVPQQPMDGASIKGSFASAGDPRSGRAQYVELYGNKGLWQDGWSLVTSHRVKTWDWNTAKTFDEPWELYDLVNDPGQTRDLSRTHPQRVASMDAEFRRQVTRFNVEPIHNLRDTAADSFKRMRADFARREGLWRYTGTVGNIPNELAPPINNMPFSLSMDVMVPATAVSGTLFAYGGRMGGVGLYLIDGVPEFRMSNLEGEYAAVSAGSTLPPGNHRLMLSVHKHTGEKGRFDYQVEMVLNGETTASATRRFAIPRYLGIAETFGVGIDNGSAVHPLVVPDTPIAAHLSNVVFDLSSEAGWVAPIEDH